MRKAIAASLAVALLFGVKSCAEPYGEAEESVEEFMEEVHEKEGYEAIKFLHPAYRDTLAKDLKLPVEFTELKPSEVLSCILSTMGANIEEVKIDGAKSINDRTASVKVRVEDKSGVIKILNFIVVMEGDEWLIADISPYTPDLQQKEE